MHNDDAFIALISTVIADGIVGGAWFGVLVALLFVVQVRTRSMLAQLEPGTPEEPAAPLNYLAYAGSLLFWPCGLVLSILFLSKPATARAGRICAWLTLAYFTFSVVLAIVIVTVVMVMYPQILAI
jgi:hypothetical protein